MKKKIFFKGDCPLFNIKAPWVSNPCSGGLKSLPTVMPAKAGISSHIEIPVFTGMTAFVKAPWVSKLRSGGLKSLPTVMPAKAGISLLIFLSLSSSFAFSAPSKVEESSYRVRKIGPWNIKIKPTELDLGTVFAGQIVLTLHTPKGEKTVFISGQHEPFKIATAKQKVQEWGGKQKSLKIQKHKKEAVLIFVDQQRSSIYWLGTDGAFLIAYVGNVNKKNYRALKSRVRRVFK